MNDIEQASLQAAIDKLISLKEQAIASLDDGLGGIAYNMVLCHSGRLPKGFPRGEFLSETTNGKCYRYDPLKVLAYIRLQLTAFDRQGNLLSLHRQLVRQLSEKDEQNG